MENPIKVDDLGGKPTIFGNTQMGGWKTKRLSLRDGFVPRKEPKEPTARTNRGGGGYDGNPGTSFQAVEQ